MSIIDSLLCALKLFDQTPARGKPLIDCDDLSGGRKHDGAGNSQHAERARDLRPPRGIDTNNADG